MGHVYQSGRERSLSKKIYPRQLSSQMKGLQPSSAHGRVAVMIQKNVDGVPVDLSTFSGNMLEAVMRIP